jgi:hypothetical protein
MAEVENALQLVDAGDEILTQTDQVERLRALRREMRTI